MRRLIGILLVAALAGCGEDDSESNSDGGNKLVGAWVYSDGGANGSFIEFKSDGQYSASHMTINGNNVYSQTEVGTYTSTDSAVTITPTRASCADAEPSEMIYSFNGKNLQLTVEATTVTFQPNPDEQTDISGMTVTTGCVDDDGNFEARAVQDL